METKKCKYCKEDIAKNAKRCPKCGGKLGIPAWIKATIIILVIMFCIVGCVNSCSTAVEESFSGYDDKNNKTSFVVGETFESSYLKVTLKSSNKDFKNYSKYATIKDGYKVVEFVFNAENIGNENQTFDYTNFDCYADGKAMQQFYSVEDAGLNGGGTISAGKSVEVPVYCEVPKDASKVTVEFKPLFADNNYEFIN